MYVNWKQFSYRHLGSKNSSTSFKEEREVACKPLAQWNIEISTTLICKRLDKGLDSLII